MATKQDQLIGSWIKEMQEFGFTHDQMIETFRNARLRFEDMQIKKIRAQADFSEPNSISADELRLPVRGFNLQKEILKQLINKLTDEFDELILEGLKRKGHRFTTLDALESFIKESCHVEDNVSHKVRMYFCDGEPFFKHYYSTEFPFIESDEWGTRLTMNGGRYEFV